MRRFALLICMLMMLVLACSARKPPTPATPATLGTDADSPARLAATLHDMGRQRIAWNNSYLALGSPLNRDMLDAETSHGVVRHIVTLEMNMSLADIIDRKGDRQLIRLGRQMRIWQQTHPLHELIVRPLHEANGNWYPWGFGLRGGKPNLKSQMYMFRQAWWHTRGVLVSQDPNLKLFWCPNGLTGTETSYDKWFPGNRNVDYVGDDFYNRSQSNENAGGAWRPPGELQAASLRALKAVAPHKPIIIGETATSEPSQRDARAGNTKAAWITQLGEWMRHEAPKQGVIMVAYFDYNKKRSNGNDWRLFPVGKLGAAASRSAFRKAMAGIP